MTRLDKLINKYKTLDNSRDSIEAAFYMLVDCFKNKNKLLVCGNGGSSSDSDHIVGELMKSFTLRRKLDSPLFEKISSYNNDLANNLQKALPCISLSAHAGLLTAYGNDNNFNYVYAQQVLGYGIKNDVLLGISTSGNSKNIVDAMHVAKTLGLKTIGLTGAQKCNLDNICDIVIKVNAISTSEIQELHLPIYHYLCKELEYYFFD